MATARGPRPAPERGLHDREIDLPRASTWSTHEPRPVSREYQRLLANPFLGLLGLIGWAWLVGRTVEARRLDLFVPALLSVLGIPCLFQYHCLDCGGTGRLGRWRGHACLRVQGRLMAGRERRLRGPTPGAQTALWLALVAVALGYWSLALRL